MLKIWSSLASSTANFFLRRGTKRPRLADSEEAEATATTIARAATAVPAAVSASDTVSALVESSAPQSKVNNNCDDAAAAAASAEKNTTRPNQAFLSNGVFSDADSAKEDNSSLCGDDYLTDDDDDDDEQFAESVSKLVAFQKTIRNVVDETRDSSGSESETDLKSQQKKSKHSESEMTSDSDLDESIRVLSKSLMDTPNTYDTAAATSQPSTSVISLLAFRKQPRTSTTTTTTAFNSTTSTANKTSTKTASTVATSAKSAAAAFSSTYNGPINLPYRCTITAKKEDKIAKQGCKMRLKEDLLKGPLLEICRKQPIYALDPPRTRSRVKQDSSGDQAGNEVVEAARTTTMKATGVTKAFHKVKMMKVRPKGANVSIEKEFIPAPKDANEKDVNSYKVTKDNNNSRNNNNNNNNNEKVKVGRSGLRSGNDKISSDNGKDIKKSRKRKANPSS